VLSGDEHVVQYRPPANVEQAPAGSDLAGLLATGDLAAVIGADLRGPDVAPMIPDAHDAALRALRRDGFHPVNHLVVVRDDLLDAHPGLAEDLFAAFAEAKRRYVADLPDTGVDAEVAAVTGADPLPYGIEPNRAVLEKLLDLTQAQHILDTRPDLEALFAKGTHGLSA
jgi:4,5-dihydroxyphthalate decarboxylase